MYRYKIILERLLWLVKEKETLSLQQIIEAAIFSFSKEQVTLIVAGRTDAGFNAYAKVAHFDLEKQYNPKNLMHSINHFSRPHTIGVIAAEMVGEEFHALFSAKARHYLYKTLNRHSVNIINKGLQNHVRHDLDLEKNAKSSKLFIETSRFQFLSC